MMLTATNKKMATSLVENTPETKRPLPPSTRSRILNSAVQFYGPDKKKVAGRNDGGDLRCSGGIANVSGNIVTIFTAAHNLLFWADLDVPPQDWTDVLTGFAKAMAVQYGHKTGQGQDVRYDLSFNKQTTEKLPLKDGVGKVVVPEINGICGFHPVRNSCSYDFAVITCTDATFAKYAKKYVFGDQENTLASEAKEMYIAGAEMLNRKSYLYIQLGFGVRNEARKKETIKDQKIKAEKFTREIILADQNGMADYTLHYRVAWPEAKDFKSVYQQTALNDKAPSYFEYPNAIILNGKQSSTSAKGDSGGPLYAIDKATRKKAYLLGVTTGADMMTDKKPASWVFESCISTSVIPYLETI